MGGTGDVMIQWRSKPVPHEIFRRTTDDETSGKSQEKPNLWNHGIMEYIFRFMITLLENQKKSLE